MGRGFRIYKERYIIVIFLDCYMRFKFVSTVHGVERIEISKAFFWQHWWDIFSENFDRRKLVS